MSNLSKLAMTLGLKFGPVRKGLTPRKILEYAVSEMVVVQTDRAVTTDPEALVHLNGMMDAYKDLAHFIAPYTRVPIKTVRASRRASSK